MFIIDFDDTIFDSYLFKHARLKALKKIGVSEELFWQTYREARNDAQGNCCYSDRRHAQVLAAKGYGESDAFDALSSVTARMKDFLLFGVEDFLQSLKKLGQPMVLLSFGDPAFQEMKVRGSGIDKYFDRLFMVQDTKEHVIQELMMATHDKDYWFINDKIDETLDLFKKFPNLKIIFKRADGLAESDYRKSGLPYFKTLAEILNYVISAIK